MSFWDQTPLVRLNFGGPPKPRPSPGGKGRPHHGAVVLAVQELVERTTLNYSAISARTGVGRASICRWKQDGGWTRPPGAPVSTDTVGGERASLKLQARTLHRRAQDIAQRYLDELENAPEIDLYALGWALEMLKEAKRARKPKKRRRPGDPPPAEEPDFTLPPLQPLPDESEPLPSPHLPELREQHRLEMAKGLHLPRRGRPPKVR